MRNRSATVKLFWAMALLACASYAQVGGPGTVTLPGVLGGAAVDLSGYVLLVGDADGQTIQGVAGANRARIEIGINEESENAMLRGPGATAATVSAEETAAYSTSPDGLTYTGTSNNGFQVSANEGVAALDVLADGTIGLSAESIRLVSSQTPPTNANDACTAGDFIPTTGFIYFCVDTDTWQRVAIATWP